MTSISSTNLVSPTVEALCQDLDTFITELSLNEQETMNTWDQVSFLVIYKSCFIYSKEATKIER
jgi:hypothetical protein